MATVVHALVQEARHVEAAVVMEARCVEKAVVQEARHVEAAVVQEARYVEAAMNSSASPFFNSQEGPQHGDEEDDEDVRGHDILESSAQDRIESHIHSRLLVDKEPAHWLLDSKPFSIAINVGVCLNSLQMGVEADHPELRETWIVVENLFTAFFLLEFLVKFASLRREYFKCHWNWLDFSLVSLSVIDGWVLSTIDLGIDLQSLSILRVLRLFRLVRILRLVKRLHKFVVVLKGLVDAMQATFWVSGVLVLILYVCAVFCVGQLGRNDAYPGWTTELIEIEDTDMMQEFNPHFFFGSMSAAMLTLFNIAILAEWQEVVRPIYLKQPMMVLFFICFIMFVTFGVMNVIVGMIVDNVMQHGQDAAKDHQQEEMAKKLAVLNQTKTVWETIDTDGDGFVSLQELQVSMEDHHSAMNCLLKEVELPRGFSAFELFSMLNEDGATDLNHDAFVECFYRLIDSGPFQHICVVQKGINQIKSSNRTTLDRLSNMEKSMARMLVAVGAEAPQSMRNKALRGSSSGVLGRSERSGTGSGNLIIGSPASVVVPKAKVSPREMWSSEPSRDPGGASCAGAFLAGAAPAAGCFVRQVAPLQGTLPQAAGKILAADTPSDAASLDVMLQAASRHAECEVQVAVNGELRHLLLASLRAMQAAAGGSSLQSVNGGAADGADASLRAELPTLVEEPWQLRPSLLPSLLNDGRVEPSIGRRLSAAFDAQTRHLGVLVQWGEQKMAL